MLAGRQPFHAEGRDLLRLDLGDVSAEHELSLHQAGDQEDQARGVRRKGVVMRCLVAEEEEDVSGEGRRRWRGRRGRGGGAGAGGGRGLHDGGSGGHGLPRGGGVAAQVGAALRPALDLDEVHRRFLSVETQGHIDQDVAHVLAEHGAYGRRFGVVLFLLIFVFIFRLEQLN